MPRAPDYELAEKDYMLGMKYKDIAEKYGVSINTVKSWKQRYNWSRKKGAHKEKGVHAKKEDATKEKIIEKVVMTEETELTEKQRLFCLYYVKSFNATQAAIKAGYTKDSAHVQGSRLLSNDKIKQEIRRLKGAMQEDIFIDAMDILNKYIKIAFADITDFIEFGREEIQVMGPFGPIFIKDEKTEEEVPVTKIVNVVKFKESDVVDGSIISEVKQGKDGASIKLADKMKALEKLEKYFDLIPDTWKRKIEEEKLNLEKRKVEGEEESQSRVVIVNDKEEMRKAMMEYDKDS